MKHLPSIFERRSYLTQASIVALVSGAFVLVTDVAGFRSLANLLWMVIVPIVVAIVMNRYGHQRVFMAMALVGVSLVVSMVIGVNFTNYG